MRTTWRRLSVAVLGMSSFGMVGCMEPQTTPTHRPANVFSGGFRTQTLSTSDMTAAFAAAEGAVADHFQIATSDPLKGLIVFAPAEQTRIGGARMRRIGQLVLTKVNDSVMASIRIEIQRYVTPNLRTMSNMFSSDDRPGVTPIEEDGGLTPAQQEYWNPEGRDSQMEAKILQRIVEAIDLSNLNGAPASAPGK